MEKQNFEKNQLLTRDAFRETVFARDSHKCVFCGKPATDAHHIMERRLWPDGGYYLNNGASVCSEHHVKCEQTVISVEETRSACGITKKILPPHLYEDHIYDKWGNPILSNGTRLKGELFFDESVQKILSSGNVLSLFTDKVKYPRTHHVPWSEGMNDDDRMMDSMSEFVGKRVVVTEKMDGENTTMYRDYIHARSVESKGHPSRNWVKQFWSVIKMDIPEKWRICGENLYAKHSIHYSELETYFLGFSMWNEYNICLNWDETKEWFELLGITPVPVLYDGIYDENKIKGLWNSLDWNNKEGYVIRLAEEIPYGDFRKKVAKFVRKGHVQTVKHWMHGQPMEKNFLKTI